MHKLQDSTLCSTEENTGWKTDSVWSFSKADLIKKINITIQSISTGFLMQVNGPHRCPKLQSYQKCTLDGEIKKLIKLYFLDNGKIIRPWPQMRLRPFITRDGGILPKLLLWPHQRTPTSQIKELQLPNHCYYYEPLMLQFLWAYMFG